MTRTGAAVLLALVVTACGSPSPPAPDDAGNKREMTRIAGTARSLPGVTDAQGDYETGITGYGRTTLSVAVTSAPTAVPAQKQLLDELERLVWHSDVRPITVLRLFVFDAGQPLDGAPAFARVYQRRDLVEGIADKLGPRPTPS